MSLMRGSTFALAGLLLTGALPAVAQEAGAGDHPRGREATAAERKERVLRATRLPEAADAARRSGIPDEEVRGVLTAIRGRQLPAGEAQVVLESAAREAREQGPIDNFGAFVGSQLDAGLRGQALAAAIHAEHAARGKGRGAGAQPAHAGPGQQGNSPAADAPDRQKRKKKKSGTEGGE
jgi:hypothetical protein